MQNARFAAFCTEANRLIAHSEGKLRDGQAYMDVLREWEPELYREITEADSRWIDPFYNNKNLTRFINYTEPRFPEYSSMCAHSPEWKGPRCKMCLEAQKRDPDG